VLLEIEYESIDDLTLAAQAAGLKLFVEREMTREWDEYWFLDRAPVPVRHTCCVPSALHDQTIRDLAGRVRVVEAAFVVRRE
jgi:hypothetical protein